MTMKNQRGMSVASRRDLPPDHALTTAPPGVIAASDSARQAFDAADRARADLRAARAQARTADGDDIAAVKDALDAGKKPPKPAAADKRAAVEELTVRLEASNALVDQRVAELYAVIETCADEWQQAERDALTAAANTASTALDDALDACRAVDQRAALVRSLHQYDAAGEVKRTTFDASGIDAASSLAKLVAAIRSAPQTVGDGPNARQMREQQRAERAAKKELRRQRLAERRKKAGTTTGFQINSKPAA